MNSSPGDNSKNILCRVFSDLVGVGQEPQEWILCGQDLKSSFAEVGVCFWLICEANHAYHCVAARGIEQPVLPRDRVARRGQGRL